MVHIYSLGLLTMQNSRLQMCLGCWGVLRTTTFNNLQGTYVSYRATCASVFAFHWPSNQGDLDLGYFTDIHL